MSCAKIKLTPGALESLTLIILNPRALKSGNVKCLISVLPFYGQDTWHASVSPHDEADTTLAEDLHLEALKQNSKQLTVMHTNTPSMISTFDNLLLAIDRYKFDVITMS